MATTKKKKAQAGSNISKPADSTGHFLIQEYDNPRSLKGGISKMAQDSLKAGAWKRDGNYIGNAPRSGKVTKYVETPRAIQNANSRLKDSSSYSHRNGGKVSKKK